jgi:AraC-like DNA-binding protein
MYLRSYTPAPPLSLFVEKFWLWEGPGQPHARERLLPTGTTELIVNLLEDQTRVYSQRDLSRPVTLPGTILCGPHAKYFVIDSDEQISVAGVHFKAGGAFPFFAAPMDELQNQHMPLDALWGPAAGELRERVLAAATHRARFRELEQCLLDRLVRPLERRPSVAFALREFHAAPQVQSIRTVTERTGLSPGRFIELFRQEVGLKPKLFCRVRRFQQVLRVMTSRKLVRWADVAVTCGYYDQAHFINDFRAFAGINPTAYPLHNGDRVNHVPLLD